MQELKSHLIAIREHELQLEGYSCQLLEEKNMYSCERQEDSSSREEYPEEPQHEENFLPK